MRETGRLMFLNSLKPNIHMRKIVSLLTVLVLCCLFAFGQTRTITGQVTDQNGSPIPFASILIKGTKLGASADQSGNFSIKAKTGDVLVFSSQGLTTREVTVGSAAVVNASLQTTNITMTEVIVSTGYNTKK